MSVRDERRPGDVARRACEAVAEHGMLPENDAPLLLMVSGGSDSTAMCLLAHELAGRGMLDPERVRVLHIDHGLRGADSDGDVLFVERLAGLCGFGFRCVRIDIDANLASFGNNMENTARNLRYEEAGRFLSALCAEAGASPGDARIWTAHTADDRVETFYMRSIVGTGPGGFASIAWRNGRVARPLLGIMRDELRAYIAARVAEAGWELDPPERAQVRGGLWREDATNYETDGFRAFVRNRLVPVAGERNPSLAQTLGRSMDLIAEEGAFLEGLVDDAARGAVWRSGGLDEGGGLEVTLDLDWLGELHPVLLRRLMHRLVKEILPPDQRAERLHIDALVAGIGDARLSIDLPGRAQARREGRRLVFRSAAAADAARESEAAAFARAGESAWLPVPGRVRLPDGTVLEAALIEAGEGRDNIVYARLHAGGDARARCAFLDARRLAAACVAAVRGAGTPGAGQSGISFVDMSGATREEETAFAWPEGAGLEVSHRREGDVLCPLGLGGAHKKLSDALVDAKVPRARRDAVPVVRAGGQIAWVAGVAVDERFKVERTGAMVRLSVGVPDVVG